MSSGDDKQNISAEIILEVIGRPAKHLTETLNNLIKNIDEEKGVSVKSKKINEPQPLKENKNFYTSFAEIEIETEEIMYLVLIVFKYMPAYVNIIYPEVIGLTNNNWNEILNELTKKLHGYDEIARILQFEHVKMQKKLKESAGIPDKPEKKEKPKKKKIKKVKK